MRIHEITEGLVQPERTTSTPLNQPYDLGQLTRDSNKRVGQGWYSYGTPNERPEEYNVATRMPSRVHLDAKYLWISTIEPYMGDNPYLPVYYNIKQHPDSLGRVRLEYQMKRYYDLRDIQLRYLELSDDFDSNDKRLVKQLTLMVRQALDDPEINFYTDNPGRVFVDFVRTCENMARGSEPITGNPEFVQAIKLIKNLLDTHPKLDNDMHTGNIMLDITPYGLVPVFTDPISDGGKSIISPHNPNIDRKSV